MPLRQRIFSRLFTWLLPFLFAASACAQELVAVPPLQRQVTDLAGMLTPKQQQELETALGQYAAARGAQIAILLTDSTAPEPIEQYSIRVADAWKLGRKGIDDGVLLLVAKNNPPALKRLRIETGRGTEGVLTDAQAKRILEDIIAPYFRKQDYYGGLAAGASAIMAALDKEPFPAPSRQDETESETASWLPLLILFLFFLAISRGRRRHAVLGGLILGSGAGRRNGWDDHSGSGWGGGGGFSGGGGGFSGGGASGNW